MGVGATCDGCLPGTGTLADPSVRENGCQWRAVLAVPASACQHFRAPPRAIHSRCWQECVWPCGGDPSVACGGASYMWTANSVYNVTAATATARQQLTPPPPPTAAAAAAAIPAPPPPAGEGSGDSAFAVRVNGVEIFARGGNLVPLELLEATVQPAYIRRTVQSAHDGNMNMVRLI